MCQTKNDSFAAAEAASTSVPVTNPMKNAVMAARGIRSILRIGTNAGPRGRRRAAAARRGPVSPAIMH